MNFIEKENIFDLSKNSSIWIGMIILVVLAANNVFSSESNPSTYNAVQWFPDDSVNYYPRNLYKILVLKNQLVLIHLQTPL